MRGGFAIGRFPHCQRNIVPVDGERRVIGFLLASDETKAAVWVPVYGLGDQLRIFRCAAHSRAAITEISRLAQFVAMHAHFVPTTDIKQRAPEEVHPGALYQPLGRIAKQSSREGCDPERSIHL